jgi:hypothetical protein
MTAASERAALEARLDSATAALVRTATELRKTRDMLRRALDSFGDPDERRMRHASVAAATIERWRATGGLTR